MDNGEQMVINGWLMMINVGKNNSKPPMTGNGQHSTCQNGEIGGFWVVPVQFVKLGFICPDYQLGVVTPKW